MTNKLAVCVITKDRREVLIEGLQRVAKELFRLGIPVYIYDASDEKNSHVLKYTQKGYSNIFYYHYPVSAFDGENALADNGVYRINKIFNETDTEYILMCGDKAFLQPEIYGEILEELEDNPDIIIGYVDLKKRIFNKPEELVEYAMVGLTYFGSTVIKKELICEAFKNYSNYHNYGFGVQNCYLYAIDKKDFTGKSMCFHFFSSKYVIQGATLNRRWECWIGGYYDWITNEMPKIFRTKQDVLLRAMDERMKFFSHSELMRQRVNNDLNIEIVKKYEEQARKIIGISYEEVYRIAASSVEELSKEYPQILTWNDLSKDRYEKYYCLLSEWLRLKNEGVSIESYFIDNNYYNIAIYGIWDIGDRLLEELKCSEVKVDFFVDKYAGDKHRGLPAIKPDRIIDKKKVDAIIVTVPYYYEEIRDNINEMVDCPIVSITDVINEIIPEL